MAKSISVRIDSSLEKQMGAFPEVNWSDVMRRGIKDYLKQRVTS